MSSAILSLCVRSALRGFASKRVVILADDVLSIAEAVSLMESIKKEQGGGEGGGASAQDLQEAAQRLPFPVPQSWASVLKVANQFSYTQNGYSFRFYSSRIIHTTSDSTFYFLREYTPAGLVIGDELTGDGLILDLSQQTSEGDCPVVVISHEGGEEAERWPSVGSFLQWLFTEQPEAA